MENSINNINNFHVNSTQILCGGLRARMSISISVCKLQFYCNLHRILGNTLVIYNSDLSVRISVFHSKIDFDTIN